MSVSSNAIVEGNSVAVVGGSNALSFRVALSKPVPAGKTVVVKYSVTNGTATGCALPGPGCDFRSVSVPLVLTFTAGQQDKVVLVKTYVDATVEPTEACKFNLVSVSGASVTIQNSLGTGYIVNDD